jgi:hypothetical protein
MTIGLTAPSRRIVDLMVSSIRIAARNPLGCAARLRSAAVTPPGPAGVLVPGDPTTTVRCEYGFGPLTSHLVGSYVLGPAKTDQLAAALANLRPDPCHCVHLGTPAPGHEEVLYFHYHDGSTLRVSGMLGANLDTYTNQRRTVANYSASIAQLLDVLSNER